MNLGPILQEYAKVVVRAWKEPAFKANLLADPIAALGAMGLRPPAGTTLNVMENTDQVRNLILPAPPSETGFSDGALEKAAIEALQGLGGFHGSY